MSIKSIFLTVALSLTAVSFCSNASEQSTNAANFANGDRVVMNKDDSLRNLTLKANDLTNRVYEACINSDAALKEQNQGLKTEACQILATKALASYSLCAVYNNPGDITDSVSNQCHSMNLIKYLGKK